MKGQFFVSFDGDAFDDIILFVEVDIIDGGLAALDGEYFAACVYVAVFEGVEDDYFFRV